MTSTLRSPRRAMLLIGVLAASLLALAPAGASAARSYGSTALQLDPGAAAALKSLNVTPGVIAPAKAKRDGLNFPITNSFGSALLGRTIKHSGGISLTAGATRVELTDFWINLDDDPDLTALVGGSRVSILDLDFRRARIGWRAGSLRIGTVTARLTAGAARALNDAFNVNAFQAGLVLGRATVKYRL